MAYTYYGKAIEKIIEFNEQKTLSKLQWDQYAIKHGYFSAETVMFIHSNTEDWDKFLENLKKRKY